MSLDFDVNCPCDCPGNAPNGGQRMITFRNVQPADLARFRAAAKADQYTGFLCPDCGCELKLGDDGVKVVTISTAKPQIRGIAPFSGPLAGGNAVSIYGHALSEPGLVVKFGGIAATNLRNVTDEAAVVTAPAGAQAGPVDVTVENTNGSYPGRGTLARGYTYIA